MQAPAPRIVIVGGGTAGWMAATLMRKRWPDSQLTLVESPDIGIIGVGEGSTPQLKAFFDQIDVTEAQWMPACNATYKLGIRFDGWSSRPGFDGYFHPFPAKLDAYCARPFVLNCYARRQGLDVDVDPDRFFINAWLARQRRGSHPAPDFPFEVQYGYHFDSNLLGGFLADLARQRGVRHLQARVTSVNQSEDGAIQSLETDVGETLRGDWFVDCTGFAAVLMRKTLGVEFRSFADNLFNDAAVVMPTPASPNPEPQTVSTAMSSGWRWHIPLTSRVGNGYVYSSSYLGADEAETELRSALGMLDEDVGARHLKMRVGQLAKHWSHNCLAVGLSQGFIEPLEATALHLVEATINHFISFLERGDFTPRHRDEFNAQVTARFEGVRDYIVCHYRANSRTDTDYWRDNASNEHLSDSLKGVLKTWLERGDLSLEVQQQQIEKYYTAVSWHCLLAGYGLFPPVTARPADNKLYCIDELAAFLDTCAGHYASHQAQLKALQ